MMSGSILRSTFAASDDFSLREGESALIKPIIHVIAMGIILPILLTGCSRSVSSAQRPTETAGLFSKDTKLCVRNGTSENLTIKWDTRAGVNSYEGQGKLLPGAQLCAEGSIVPAQVTFPSGFATVVEAQNPAIGYPAVTFYSGDHVTYRTEEDVIITGVEYASAFYSEGETVNSNVEGHQITTTRLQNNSWVNFLVTIKY